MLHKTQLANPTNVEDWKGLYEIGDKIKITAQEFRTIGEDKRVVWTQI